MLPNRTYLHIANFLLRWVRLDETHERLASLTQREIRDELFRLVQIPAAEGYRIANELTRWVFSGDPRMMEMRWKDDLWCRKILLRLVEEAAIKEGAEDDEDISDDLTAASYPRLRERIADSYRNMVSFMKEKQTVGSPVREAERGLIRLLKGSVEDWELSI